MFHKCFKSFLFILIVGCLYGGAQSKECYSCEGINCLRTSKINDKVTCIDPLDDCVTIFDKFTTIARGCYSTLPEEQRRKCEGLSNIGCHKCYTSLCNDKGAISCIQCNSEDNKNCYNGVSQIEATRCPVSTSPNSYCYIRTSSDKIERGCLIDTIQQLRCMGDSSCEMCITDGIDSCNRESVDNAGSGSDRLIISSITLLTGWLILSL